MKVNVLAASFYPAVIYGGPILSVLGQCKALADLDVDVRVITTNAHGVEKLKVSVDRFIDIQPRLAVIYYNDTVIGRFSASMAASTWLNVSTCDILHSQELFYIHVPQFLLAARVLKKPVLLSPRGVLSPWALEHRRSWAKTAWLKTVIA